MQTTATAAQATPRIAANCLGVDVPASPYLHDRRIARLNAGTYEEQEILGALRCVRPGDTVLELGAGLGIVGAIVARNLRPARVRSFEANPALIPHIEALYALNGLTDRIAVENRVLLAGPDQPEEVTLHLTNSYLGSSVHEKSEVRSAVQVPTGDFDTACAGAEVLIMDIEGAEIDILRQADLSGLRAVVIEFHPGVYGRAGLIECKDRLRAAGLAPIASVSTRRVWACERAGVR
ncbi:FkbM family methyltransferase [Pseudooceanicola sp. LIPI14-2-Ac024]|uniref:FkbM family methyltransferase n=1 Tax=Pseudooceanicola sp. LIPI14-2-Ac024 TaxID=3344875 RepID=UPI0035D0C4E9